jgi:hypothetical protein
MSDDRPNMVGQHLTDEDFSDVLDGSLSADRQQIVDAHLVDCVDCRNAIADLAAISQALSSLELKSVPRSFQLEAEYARGNTSFWSRIASSLIPLLPAMRAGTLAIAIALGGITAARVLQDAPQPSTLNDMDAAPAITVPTDDLAREIEETATVIDLVATLPAEKAPHPSGTETGADVSEDVPDEFPSGTEMGETVDPIGNDSGGADSDDSDSTNAESEGAPGAADTRTTEDGTTSGEAAGNGSADDASDQSESAPSESDTSAADQTDEESSDEAFETSAMVVEPTETPSPTATTSPSPTVTFSPSPSSTAAMVSASPQPDASPPVTDGGDRDWPFGWIQAILAGLFAAMGAAVIGIGRAARRS